jgi:hypothetical protein
LLKPFFNKSVCVPLPAYYTVLQLDTGFHGVPLEIPEDLDLLIFTAGGISRAPRVQNIAVPLLKVPGVGGFAGAFFNLFFI